MNALVGSPDWLLEDEGLPSWWTIVVMVGLKMGCVYEKSSFPIPTLGCWNPAVESGLFGVGRGTGAGTGTAVTAVGMGTVQRREDLRLGSSTFLRVSARTESVGSYGGGGPHWSP